MLKRRCACSAILIIVAGGFISLAGLVHAEPQDRQALLERSQQRSAAEALVRELTEADDDEALERIERELAELGPPAMIALRLAEQGEHFELRQRAERMAARVRWRQASEPSLLEDHPQLIDIMAEGARQARGELVDQIGEAARRDAVGFLRECLADEQTFVRERAVAGLASIAREHAGQRGPVVSELERVLAEGGHDERMLAISALTQLEAFDVDLLTELLASESMELRRSAIRSLGYSGKADAVEPVLSMLDADEWRLRAASLEALRELVDAAPRSAWPHPGPDDPSADDVPRNRIERELNALLPLLRDEDDFVRVRALELLARLDSQQARHKIEQLIEQGEIDEHSGLSVLVEQGHPPAVARAIERFDQAQTLEQRQQWLALLESDRDHPQVSQLLARLLSDAEHRDLWPEVIEAVRYRHQDRALLMPLIVQHLDDPDQRIAAAAWESSRRHLQTYPPTQSQIQAMWEAEQPQLRKRALTFGYEHDRTRIGSRVTQALADDDAQVLALALGIVGKLELNDALGAELADDRTHDTYMPVPHEPEQAPTLGLEQWQGKVAQLLHHDAALVRTRAAALLYRSEVDTHAEQAEQVLIAGLDSNESPTVVAALAGIEQSPHDFEQHLNLSDMVRRQSTAARALNVMARLGSAYADELIELAEQADARDHALTVALARTGDPEAIAAAIARANDLERFEMRSLGHAMAGASGHGIVELLEALWHRDDLQDFDKEPIAQAAMMIDEPEVADLLLQILEQSDPQRGAILVQRSRVIERLASIAPDDAIELITEQLRRGHLREQREALDLLRRMEPTDAAVDAVLELAREIDQGPTDWSLVANWLPDSALTEQFMPAADALPDSLVLGMARRVGNQMQPDDLDWLLTLELETPLARSLASQMVAELTRQPEHRPELADASASALVLLLEAAGDWEQGRQAVAAYLNDERDAVAAAAVRGLGIHLATRGTAGTPLESDERQALLNAVKQPPPHTAHLAAVGLARAAPEALDELSHEAVATSSAALAIAIAVPQTHHLAQDRIPQAMDDPIGNTPGRLAAILAAQGVEDDAWLAEQALLILWQHPDLIDTMIAQTGSVHAAATVAQYWPTLEPWTDQHALRRTIEPQAWRDEPSHFAAAARAGWIDQPGEAELELLLEAIEQRSVHAPLGELTDPDDPLPSLLSVGLRWAAAIDEHAIIQHMGTDSSREVAAAVFAAQALHDPPARDVLTAVATEATGHGWRIDFQEQQQRILALRTLGWVGQERELNAIIDFERSLHRNDWDQRDLADRLLFTLAPRRPQQVLDRKRELATHDRFRTSHSADAQLSVAELKAATFDQTGHMTADEPWQSLAGALLAASANPDHEQAARKLLPPWEPDREAQMQRLGYDPYAIELATRAPHATQPRSSQAMQRLLQWVAGDWPEGSEDWRAYDRRMLDWAGWAWSQPARDRLERSGMDAERDPALFYMGYIRHNASTASQTDRAELSAQLKPLIAHQDPLVRQRAMRTAAAWQLADLDQPIADRLDSGQRRDRIEAAWALAALRGSDAVAQIRNAKQAADDFHEQVKHAALLRLLGQRDVGAQTLDRAQSLLISRQLRGRAVTNLEHEQASDPAASSQTSQQHNQRPGAILDDGYVPAPFLPWRASVSLALEPSLREHQSLLGLPGMPPWHQASNTQPASTHWFLDSQGRVQVGENAPTARAASTLPIEPLLAGHPQHAPAFARLSAAEQHLEARFFIQFAHQLEHAAELTQAWSQWWDAHSQADRDIWWKQAVQNAIDELEHDQWWHRARAARRLERLTGHQHQVAIFGDPGIQRMHSAWQRWWDEHADIPPAVVVLKAAERADVIEPGTAQAAGDDPALLLNKLVKTADADDRTLATAARLQLAGWEDDQQLIDAALDWQHARDPLLRQWIREHAVRRAGEQRLIYESISHQ